MARKPKNSAKKVHKPARATMRAGRQRSGPSPDAAQAPPKKGASRARSGAATPAPVRAEPDQGPNASAAGPSDGSALVNELERLKAQLLAEHVAGPPDRSVLVADVFRCQTEADRVRRAIVVEKALAKKRKAEIDDWKLWYHSLSVGEKPAALLKLDAEIAWRANELDAVGNQINALNVAEVAAMGALEHAKQLLAAFDAGAYQRVAAEDPRLKGLEEALLRAHVSSVST
jgi:hypothetical protein